MRVLALAALSCGCLADPATYGNGGSGGSGGGGAAGTGGVAAGAGTPNGGAGGEAAGGAPEGGSAPEQLNVDWVLPLGNPAQQSLTALAVDETGQVFVGGQWTGEFEQSPLGGDCQGSDHAYVQAVHANGDASWLRCFGGMAEVEAIDVNADGYIAVVGSFQSGISFNFGATVANSKGGTDIFVVVLDPDGNTVWGQPYGSPMDDRGMGVAIDDDGIVYVSGSFRGVVNFDTHSVSAPVGANLFLARIDAGTPSWAHQLDNGGVSPTLRIAIRRGADGPIVGAGSFEGVLDVDSAVGPEAPITAEDQTDAFTVGFNVAGAPTFLNPIAGAARQEANGIQSSAGAFFVAGLFGATVDFDTNSGPLPALDSGGDLAAFGLTYDFGGQLVGQQALASGGTVRGLEMGVDRNDADSTCLAGNFDGELPLSNGEASAQPDGTDGFLQCYTVPPRAVPTHARAIGGARGIQSVNGVAKYGPAILIGGTFQAELDLGEGYTSKGGDDVFIAKLAPPQ